MMKKSMIAATAALLLLLLFAIVVFAEEPDHEHVAGESKITVLATPTCAAEGSYQETTLCAICGAEMETVTVTVGKTKDHVPGEAVNENVVPATHTTPGSYDSVIYCEVCGTELARTHVIIPGPDDYHISEYALTRTVIQKEDGCYVTFEDKTYPDIKKDSSMMAPLVGKTFAPGEYYLGDGSERTCADGEERCLICGTLLKPAIPHVWDSSNWVASEKYPWSSQKVYQCLICGAEHQEPTGGCLGGEKYYPYGDVDGDYKVTEADARLALRASVQLEEYDSASRDFYCADYDGDGKLTAEDARSILQTAVNMKSLRWVGYSPYYDPEPGDVDGNGAVTPLDARIVLRYSVGLGQLDKVIVGDDQVKAADIDENGKVESADARLILRLAVGLPID